jgi:hypothetical protein
MARQEDDLSDGVCRVWVDGEHEGVILVEVDPDIGGDFPIDLTEFAVVDEPLEEVREAAVPIAVPRTIIPVVRAELLAILVLATRWEPR